MNYAYKFDMQRSSHFLSYFCFTQTNEVKFKVVEFKVGDKAVYPAQGVAEVIDIEEKFSLFTKHWTPKIIS